jgi:biopolymer transport protein ExbB
MYEIMESGGPVMWPLLLCSIAVLTVVLERALFWIALERKRKRQLMDEILVLAESGNWELIREKTAGSRDYIIHILVVGILHREFDMIRAMEAEAELMVQRMQRFMPVLDTMITVAPLLGILGTVIGIIGSFKMLGAGPITDPKLITGGIAQALITTATGLTISIVAVIPFNYFNTRIEHAIHVMEKYSNCLEVVFNKVVVKGPSQNENQTSYPQACAHRDTSSH